MRLTLIPFNCHRGCKFCYLPKDVQENTAEYFASMQKLKASRLFDNSTIFFNSPGLCGTQERIDTFIETFKAFPKSDIYIDWADFKDNLKHFHQDGIKTPISISKFSFNVDDIEYLEHITIMNNPITIVHLINSSWTVDDVCANIPKTSPNIAHYILFEKPYKVGDVSIDILKISELRFKSLSYEIEVDQCVNLAVGSVQISESDGIEGRVELYPDGKVSFCPYFGERVEIPAQLDASLTDKCSICDSCQYLNKEA